MSPSPVRRLEPRDLTELVQLCREHAVYERAPWVERDRTSALGALLLDSEDARGWVVEGDGELAGFATATLERSTWDAGHFLHLDCIFLRAGYRGRGIGRRLVAEVAAAATELRAVNLQWQTPAWNEDAARFYRRLGASAAEKLRFTLSPQQCAGLAATRDSAGPPTRS